MLIRAEPASQPAGRAAVSWRAAIDHDPHLAGSSTLESHTGWTPRTARPVRPRSRSSLRGGRTSRPTRTAARQRRRREDWQIRMLLRLRPICIACANLTAALRRGAPRPRKINTLRDIRYDQSSRTRAAAGWRGVGGGGTARQREGVGTAACTGVRQAGNAVVTSVCDVVRYIKRD